MSENTFVEACLSGDALLDEIDDWVDAWHDSPDETRTLDQYLGFSYEEGALWAEKPSALRIIIAARQTSTPLPRMFDSTNGFALAARASDQSKAQEVAAWLKSTGRLHSGHAN